MRIEIKYWLWMVVLLLGLGGCGEPRATQAPQSNAALEHAMTPQASMPANAPGATVAATAAPGSGCELQTGCAAEVATVASTAGPAEVVSGYPIMYFIESGT